MTKNSLKLITDTKAEIKGVQKTPSRIKHTHVYTSYTNH